MIDVYFQSDIRAAILAGLVLCVHTARATGDNVEFLRGAVAAYQHMALAFKIPWSGLLTTARGSLGDDLGALLATASGLLEG
jgi:hypothetical protein